jgi:serine/threonine-protein kinase TTK/MPS1
VNGGRQRGQSVLSVNVNAGLSAALSVSGSSRPRRSASLSDALSRFLQTKIPSTKPEFIFPGNNDEYQLQLQHQYQNPGSRPGTSLGANRLLSSWAFISSIFSFSTGVHSSADNASGGPRRVTIQERERHDVESRSDYKSMFKLQYLYGKYLKS